jgi:proline iminopeptidase
MKWLTDEMLPVSDGHRLCVRSTGNPDGIPAVFLHGGPGSGVQESQLGVFDLDRFHVIAFDQRGAGLSTPKGGRDGNTTAHLVADIEAIRDRFGIDRWLVVGGSWGATLALAYATAHPERVQGLVLRAVFLGTRAELERAFLVHLPTFYPALHADWLSMLPETERARPLDAYWARILDPDPAVHLPAARAWHDTERALSSLVPSATRLDMRAVQAATGPVPSSPYMEAHYFSNDCFLDGDLRDRTRALGDIPGLVVQGRFDLLCPPETSHALAEAWPGAEVHEVEGAGHSMGDKSVFAAVRDALSEIADRL